MFSEPKTILLVDNNSTYVLPVLRCLSACRYISVDILVCSQNNPGFFRHSRHLRKLYWAKKEIVEDFPETIIRYIKKSEADMVMPTGEEATRLLIEHRNEIEANAVVHAVPDMETLDLVTNKWKLSSWLSREGFPSVKSELIQTSEFGKSGIPAMKFPVLCKPVKGAGGKGIRFLEDSAALKMTTLELGAKVQTYLVQEYIDGYDIDISFFAVNGDIIFHTIQKGIVTGGFSYARGIEFLKNEDLLDLSRQIVKEMNYTGIAHLDFRYDEVQKQYMLVDFNARYWTTLLGSSIMGVNFPLLVAAYCLGEYADQPDYKSGFYFSTKAGINTALQNFRRKKRILVRLREIQLYDSLRDPLPEVVTLLAKLKNKFVRKAD